MSVTTRVIRSPRVVEDFGKLNLSAYFCANYYGAPWVGLPSRGNSGEHNATELTDPPADNDGSADGDGINDELLLSGTLDQYIKPNHVFSAAMVVLARSGDPALFYDPFTDPTLGPHKERTLIGGEGAMLAPLTITSDMGVGVFGTAGSGGWRSAHVPMSFDEWHVVTVQLGYPNLSKQYPISKLSIGVDGPPDTSVLIRETDWSLTFRDLHMFRGFINSGNTYADGQIKAFLMSPDLWDRRLFQGVVNELKRRFDIETSQVSNVSRKRVRVPANGYAASYTGTVVTSNSQISQRDGAHIQYLPGTGKYWLFGGWHATPRPEWDDTQTTNEVWSCDTPDFSNAVLELAHDIDSTTRPRPRHTYGTAYAGGYWYIIGSDQYGDRIPDVWRTNDGVTWERRRAWGPWNQKAGLCVGSLGTEIHVVGGALCESENIDIATSQHFRSQDGGVTWEQLPDAPFSRCYVGRMVEYNGLLILSGGAAGNMGNIDFGSRELRNDTWAFDGEVWHLQSESAIWSPRLWADNIVYDNKIWILAGRDQPETDADSSAFYSEDAGRTWVEVPAPWDPTHADGVTATEQDGIVMVSGFGIGTKSYTLKLDE